MFSRSWDASLFTGNLVSHRYDIDFFARHVADVDNSIADQLGRWHLSPVHRARFATFTQLDSRHAHRTRSIFTSFASTRD